MPERALYLQWQIEKGLTWAQNLDTACERFQARTGQVATHALVSVQAGAPPDGCRLAWRPSFSVLPSFFYVGVEAQP